MRLRKLEKKDASGMLEWMHDETIQKCFRFNTMNKTMGDVLGFIESADISWNDEADVHYAVVDDNDEYLGTVSMKELDFGNKKCEFAISLRKMAQGQGVGSWCLKEVLRIAFEEHDFNKVYLNVLADNINAIRLYEKSGFVYEGEFREELFLRGEYRSLKWYSILKSEYLGGTEQ